MFIKWSEDVLENVSPSDELIYIHMNKYISVETENSSQSEKKATKKNLLKNKLLKINK